jgi:hypothetical protein
MKKLILLASILLPILTVNATYAAGKKASKKAHPQAKLGTSFKFDGTTLRGKYQTSLGTNATVENDKYLDDLLAGRKNFQDRVQEDEKRN